MILDIKENTFYWTKGLSDFHFEWDSHTLISKFNLRQWRARTEIKWQLETTNIRETYKISQSRGVFFSPLAAFSPSCINRLNWASIYHVQTINTTVRNSVQIIHWKTNNAMSWGEIIYTITNIEHLAFKQSIYLSRAEHKHNSKRHWKNTLNYKHYCNKYQIQ